ncbi:hypothetical protein FCE95_10180 [Luteimonas gilva]|uniref:Outer membrane lipoprotein carrier protein LolA n=1 Tax=Luteimonas gilva TaxID=2572684 RepID=A0A4U5JPY5_9GAMM|nr:hypothetical protein [Luteimonas gilva]TKR30478.1 hypothetical protein FCE95_10180 [Luteimonas gilva]
MRRFVPLALVAALTVLVGCKQQTEPAGPAAAQESAPAAAPSPVAAAAEALAPTSPKDEIKAAMAAFLEAKSFHADMEIDNPQMPGGKMKATMDFVAPDRYRMQMPMGTQTIVGDTLYMTMQGKTMKVPMQKDQLAQWRDPGKINEHEATMTVEAQGSDAVDGTPARKYAVRNTQPQPVEMTLWVSEAHLPLQILNRMEMQGKSVETRIRYSRYNDASIKIDPPQ